MGLDARLDLWKIGRMPRSPLRFRNASSTLQITYTPAPGPPGSNSGCGAGQGAIAFGLVASGRPGELIAWRHIAYAPAVLPNGLLSAMSVHVGQRWIVAEVDRPGRSFLDETWRPSERQLALHDVVEGDPSVRLFRAWLRRAMALLLSYGRGSQYRRPSCFPRPRPEVAPSLGPNVHRIRATSPPLSLPQS